jgi:L-ascorbate metabolism protein UlaG (beta-lactamase superfamily)
MQFGRPRFPVSDHCDGWRFFNPGTQPRKGNLLHFLRWRLTREGTGWPVPPADGPFAPPPSAVPAGTAAITFINHSTFLLRLPDAVVLTDPMFSPRCSPLTWAGPKRVRPPGLALADVPRPDVVLLSHCHYDHMDLPTLRELQRRHAPRFVTLSGNAQLLRSAGIEATELDRWEGVTIGSLGLTATPARHFSARTPFDRNRRLWGGFMIGAGGGRILFAGDSGAGRHWEEIAARIGAPDVALVPIGAYEPRWFMAPMHMNPAEAVEAHLALGATRSVGMHFGTFRLADEAIEAPLIALAEATLAAGIEPGTFTTQGFGETGLYGLGSFCSPDKQP